MPSRSSKDHDFTRLALRAVEQATDDSQDGEPVDAQTAAKLDAARAEGGQPVLLQEVKRRYGL
jgi:hypothetical protein